MRILLTYVLPIVLPTALYIGWLVYVGRHQGRKLPHWDDGPWFWLFLAGFVLGAGSLIYFGLSGVTGTEGTYVAPHFQDGRIVPGQVR